MQVNSVNIDPRQVYYRPKSLFAENYSSNYSINEKGKLEQQTADQKNTVVTDKLPNEPAIHLNDVRFQENTPVSNLLNLIKNFNEPNRSSLPKIENSENHFHATFTEVDEAANDETPVGYYIVLDEKQKVKKQKALKGRFDLVKDRIAKTYNLNSYRTNGALVNLTA